MKKVLGVFLGLIALCIVGIIIVFAFPTTNNFAGNIAGSAKAAVANVALNASGVKDKIASTVESKKDVIVDATGLNASEVDTALANLDIDSWQVVTLPPDATETDTIDGSTFGMDGSITLYDDLDYVTINAYGQSITMSVPESAQQYLALAASQ